MKWWANILSALVLVLGIGSLSVSHAEVRLQLTPAAATQDNISVYFSPGGGCTEAIVSEISKAQNTIWLQAYSFTSVPIAKAMLDAHKRGVEVVAVLDKSQRTEKYTSATFLSNQGVPVFIDAKHAIAHNKIILIDRRTIITGSFNFSKAAEESNAENLLVIHDKPDLMLAFERNFQRHREHSENYTGPLDASEVPALPRPAEGPPQNQSVMVYVTKSGTKYHADQCRTTGDVTPLRLNDAKAKGLEPCKVCGPAE